MISFSGSYSGIKYIISTSYGSYFPDESKLPSCPPAPASLHPCLPPLVPPCFSTHFSFLYVSIYKPPSFIHLIWPHIVSSPVLVVCSFLKNFKLSFIEYSIAPEWSRSNHMSQTKLDASPKWDNQVANQPSQMDHPMDFLEQIQIVLG